MLKDIIDNRLKAAYKTSQNAGNALAVIGTVGWIISMFAQITAVKTNKHLPEDKKKILLAQETTDGLSNAALFLGFTKFLTKVVEKKVDQGKILPEDLLEKLTNFSKGTGYTIQETIKACCTPKDIIKPSSIEEGIIKKINPKTATEIYHFKSGAGVIATIIGSVIATNIATPLVRNKMGNYYQSKAKALEAQKNLGKPLPVETPTKTLTPPAFTKSATFATFSNITKI